MINIDTSTKIFISTHKDFQSYPKEKEYCIICGKGDLKNKYDIPVIEEDWNNKYIPMHMSYAELTRLFYIYNKFHRLPEYVGFCQYKRMFRFNNKNINISEEVEKIFKEHDAILPPTVMQFKDVKSAYGNYHRINEIEAAEEIVKKKFPHFAKSMEEVFYGKRLHPHNTFIMKQKDFRDYCYFLQTIMNELDRQNGWSNMETIKASGIRQDKTHGFLAERLSDVFYHERFKNPLEMIV